MAKIVGARDQPIMIVPNAGSNAVTGPLCADNVFRTSFSNWQPSYPGGTMMAGMRLLQRLGAQVIEGAAIVDLPELGGSQRLRESGLDVFTLVAFDGIMALQQKIARQELTGDGRPRHLREDQPSEFPIPEFGEHDLVPPNNPKVWHAPVVVR